MSVYVMVGLNIRDEVKYAEYGAAAVASLMAHHVEVLAATDAPVSLEGSNPFARYVLLKFADQAAVDACYNSPAYQAAVPLRQANAETGFMVALPSLG